MEFRAGPARTGPIFDVGPTGSGWAGPAQPIASSSVGTLSGISETKDANRGLFKQQTLTSGPTCPPSRDREVRSPSVLLSFLLDSLPARGGQEARMSSISPGQLLSWDDAPQLLLTSGQPLAWDDTAQIYSALKKTRPNQAGRALKNVTCYQTQNQSSSDSPPTPAFRNVVREELICDVLNETSLTKVEKKEAAKICSQVGSVNFLNSLSGYHHYNVILRPNGLIDYISCNDMIDIADVVEMIVISFNFGLYAFALRPLFFSNSQSVSPSHPWPVATLKVHDPSALYSHLPHLWSTQMTYVLCISLRPKTPKCVVCHQTRSKTRLAAEHYLAQSPRRRLLRCRFTANIEMEEHIREWRKTKKPQDLKPLHIRIEGDANSSSFSVFIF
ncbi:hypothetical protein PHJA_001856200 [Phtheirospermum japonicum]|uniref:Uncharacterized protein n=1 Tax=Phtheirospermum japonicum TaxID=374723 RepID=A0A830CRT9_9LAMI|nr:hypothetical protein PHJA_001856200 [Phtheirospermum japonicum]